MKTFKKALACFLVVAMFLTAAPLSGFVGLQWPDLNLPGIDFGNVFNKNAAAAEITDSGTCGENLTWTLDDAGTLTISGTGAMSYSFAPWGYLHGIIKKVVIKDGVTNIGDYAFQYCANLASITIPDSVTSIGEKAFDGCLKLANITLPYSVTSIGEKAFVDCTKLANITLPDSVTTIGDQAFAGTAYFNDTNNWDNDALYINNHLIIVFNSFISDFIIEDGTKTIADCAFYGCLGLMNITIPDSVTSIGEDAFSCTNIANVYFDGNIAAWCNIAFKNITSNPLCREANLYLNGKPATNISIPDGVTKIQYQFENCTNLVNITIPGSVTTISNHAFYGCRNIASITVSKDNANYSSDEYGVLFNKEKTQLIQYPFKNNATEYRIPNTVKSISDLSFFLCCNLVNITIPDSVTSIDSDAFVGCTALKSVTFGENSQLTTIGSNAYQECVSLVNITIPDSVTSIGKAAFIGCYSLAAITILNPECEIYDSESTICSGTTIYSYTGSTVEAYATKYNRTFVSLGDAPQPHTHFYTATVTLAATCCTTGVMTYACECEDSYTEVIPFDANNHTGGTELRDAREATKEAPGYTGDTYCLGCNTKIADGEPIPYIPEIIASGTCGENLTWTLDDAGTLTIFGTGAMWDYSSSPWDSNRSAIKNVVIEDGVTTIGDYAFQYCKSLTSVTIPDSVTSIGAHAFENCTSLTSVTIGDSVTSIGNYAFWECESLTAVHISDIAAWCNIDFDGYYANPLYYAHNLYINGTLVTTLTIPDSVTSIGNWEFYGCTKLTSVTIGDSVTSIGYYAFFGCTSLGEIVIKNKDCQIYDSSNTIPANAVIRGHDDSTAQSYAEKYNRGFVSIDGAGSDIILSGYCGDNADFTLTRGGTLHITGTGAVYSYKSSTARPWYKYRGFIRTVIIDDGITEIGDSAFSQFYNLLSVTIPDSVTSIGDYVFRDCTSLASVTIPDSVTSIGAAAFYNCLSLTSVTIPDSVTSIGGSAFRYCTSLTSVTIGNSVTSIGGSAFSGCDSLTSVTIGNSVTSIGDSAFSWCTLLTSVTIPDSVTSIGNSAFEDCTSLTSVTFSANSRLTSIGERAFEGCTSLTSVTIGNSVTSIGYAAFRDCTSLTSITIGSSVTSIGDYAFYNCTKLTDITVDADNTAYCSEDGVLFNKSKTELIQYPVGNARTSYTIPDSVTSIEDYAFYDSANLASITVPDSVTSIGRSAFYGTAYYENPNNWEDKVLYIDCHLVAANKYSISVDYVIKNGTVTIADYVFARTDAIESDCPIRSITIPDSVTNIGYAAFSDCTSLKSITFGDNSQLTSIGDYAFYKCTSLASVDFGDNNQLTSIGDYAFYTCTGLASITIPDSVTSIGYAAFRDCTSLTSISILNPACEIYDSSNTIDDGAVIYGYTNSTAQAYAEKYNRTFVSLGDAPHTHSYTSSITLAATCCTTGVKTYTCECEDSYTEVIDFDFNNHTGGTEVRDAKAPTSTEEGYTGDTYCLGCNTKIANGESIPYTPEIIASGTCGENLTWTLDDAGTLTISGTGEMENYNDYWNNYSPWYSNRTSVKKIVIENGVTSIGEYAFYYCTKLTSVTIPDSVTSIGYSAFEDCTSLTSVTIPDSVTSIGNYAFYYCTKLTSVTIPDSVTSIGDWAFLNCTSLTDITVDADNTAYCSEDGVLFNKSKTELIQYPIGNARTSYTIPDSVTSIGGYAFYNCTKLTSVTIPDSVTSTGWDAFYNCTSLTSVHISDIAAWCNIDFDDSYANPLYYAHNLYINGTLVTTLTIPDSVTSIGDYAFRHCTSLTSVTIGNSVTSIGDDAFRHCTSLTSVTIGDSVTSIGGSAFSYCESLTSVTIPDNVTSIGDYAFFDCTSLAAVHISDIAAWCNIDFDGCYANPLCCAHNLYLNGTLVTELTIPDSVTSIGEFAFWYCTSLTSVTIPDSVMSIGEQAFSYCTSLTSVTIGDSVTSIGWNAFWCCTSLTSVTIPNSVTSIEGAAFWYCTSLTSVTILNPACEIYDSANTIYSGTTIYGYTDSTAQAYAEKYNRNFVALDEPDPHEHSYTGTVTLPATCCTTGVKTYTCECEDSYTEIIPFDFTNHVGGTEVRDAVPATCTDGYTGDTYCLGCNTKIADGETILGTGAHTPDSYTEPASCTVNGYTMTFCTECGEELDFEVIPAAHKPGADATCTTAQTCTVCGEELTPALGHTWGEWFVVTEATFETTGLKKRICSVCTAEETEIIPVLETKEFEDKDSGVSVETDKDAYGGKDIEVKVEEVFDGSHYLTQSFGKVETWNIKTYVDGEQVQPETPVYVRIPLPEGFDPNKTFVYHINSQTNEREKMDVQVIDGYICFYTTSFSLYIVVDESSLIENPTELIIYKPYTIAKESADGFAVVSVNTTVADILAACNATTVLTATGEKADATEKLATGMQIVLLDGESVVDSMKIVVLGDIDGDGNVSSADARLALRASVKLETLNAEETLAADVEHDNTIAASDARIILRGSVNLDDPASWLMNF